jgi:hypothetical protein
MAMLEKARHPANDISYPAPLRIADINKQGGKKSEKWRNLF